MKYYLLSIVAFALIGCNKNLNDNTLSPNPDNDKIPISIATRPVTRVTDVAYERGDRVGIYTVNQINGQSRPLELMGNHVDNLAFTYNGIEWESDKEAYWKDSKTAADFYCYFPYKSVISDIYAVPFSVKTDQSTLAGYQASELMYGKTLGVRPSEKAVSIITNHAMSNLIIYLQPGKGYTAETLAAETISITINNVKTDATLNLSTGETEATGTPKNITPYKTRQYWKALVVPQEISGARLLTIRVGQYTYYMDQTITFKSNTQHRCTLIVNKLNEGVNIGIGGWQNDENDFGGVLE